jgi:hypothetical protein
MFNEYGAVDGNRTGKKAKVFGEKPTHCHFVHHKFQMA